MTDLLVKNIDDDVRGRLEALASSHGHSVEDEVREIIRDAVKADPSAVPSKPGGLGDRLVALFSGSGIGLTEEEAKLIQEFRGHPARPVDFER